MKFNLKWQISGYFENCINAHFFFRTTKQTLLHSRAALNFFNPTRSCCHLTFLPSNNSGGTIHHTQHDANDDNNDDDDDDNDGKGGVVAQSIRRSPTGRKVRGSSATVTEIFSPLDWSARCQYNVTGWRLRY